LRSCKRILSCSANTSLLIIASFYLRLIDRSVLPRETPAPASFSIVSRNSSKLKMSKERTALMFMTKGKTVLMRNLMPPKPETSSRKPSSKPWKTYHRERRLTVS
jgi:hypothetical protein